MQNKEDWRGLTAGGLLIGSLMGVDVALFLQLEPSVQDQFLRLYLILAPIVCLVAKGIVDHGKHYH
jgi:hypothetical protein